MEILRCAQPYLCSWKRVSPFGSAWCVKRKPRKSHSASAHQTVTGAIKLNTGKKTITITTTAQKLSAHAGQTTFWGFLALRKVRALLSAALPHRPTSPNARPPFETALGFIAGILAGADKLARIAHLRDDPVLPEVMEIKRLPSQSRLSRWLCVFDGAGRNLRAFRVLWRWGMERLGEQASSCWSAPAANTRRS